MGRHYKYDKPAKFDHVKADKACVKELKSSEIKSNNLVLDGVDVTDILGAQGNIGITGELDCTTDNPDSILGVNTPVFDPSKGVAETVFNAMLETAQEIIYNEPPQSEGLQYRLTQGRARLGLPGPSKVRVVGSITFAPWTPSFPNDPSKSDFVNYNTDLGWNLLCANSGEFIDGVKPNPGVVSVYAQYAYIDKVTGVCKCGLLDLGNKQIEPSIDYKLGDDLMSWGEQFTGTKVVDSGIITEIFKNMPDPKATGGIQMLFVAEEQVQVLRLEKCEENRATTNITICGNNCTINTHQTNNVNTSGVVRI